MPVPSVTLIGKAGCHLCDDAREVVGGVIAQLDAQGVTVAVTERSILDEPELASKWADDIPVVLIGTALHDRWRVDAQRLRDDLLIAAR